MRALLVDLFDTLVWVDWPIVSEHLSRRLGVGVEELFQAFVKTSPSRSVGRHGSFAGDLAALAAACGRESKPADLQRAADETIALSRRHVHLYADVLPALRELRSQGTKVAVVSNCDHATPPIVVALNLEREVDAVVLSCRVGCKKPDAAIFIEALRRVEAKPGDAVFVDDQAAYLDGAAALGMRTFQIFRRDAPEPEASASHAAIRDFTTLLTLAGRRGWAPG